MNYEYFIFENKKFAFDIEEPIVFGFNSIISHIISFRNIFYD